MSYEVLLKKTSKKTISTQYLLNNTEDAVQRHAILCNINTNNSRFSKKKKKSLKRNVKEWVEEYPHPSLYEKYGDQQLMIPSSFVKGVGQVVQVLEAVDRPHTLYSSTTQVGGKRITFFLLYYLKMKISVLYIILRVFKFGLKQQAYNIKLQ